MTSAREIAVVAIAAYIFARQRQLDLVMQNDLRQLKRKHGDQLVMRACAIADRQLAAPEPRRPQPTAGGADDAELLAAIER
jgi:hypothetical protein